MPRARATAAGRSATRRTARPSRDASVHRRPGARDRPAASASASNSASAAIASEHAPAPVRVARPSVRRRANAARDCARAMRRGRGLLRDRWRCVRRLRRSFGVRGVAIAVDASPSALDPAAAVDGFGRVLDARVVVARSACDRRGSAASSRRRSCGRCRRLRPVLLSTGSPAPTQHGRIATRATRRRLAGDRIDGDQELAMRAEDEHARYSITPRGAAVRRGGGRRCGSSRLRARPAARRTTAA